MQPNPSPGSGGGNYPSGNSYSGSYPPNDFSTPDLNLQPEDPSRLVERLVQAAPTMSAANRAEAARRLAAAGFALPANGPRQTGQAQEIGGLPGLAPALQDILQSLLTRLEIPPSAVDLGRLVQVIEQVFELAITPESLAWNIWRQQIAQQPHPVVRRTHQLLRDEIRSFLQASPLSSRERVRITVSEFRRLILSAFSALAEAPRVLSKSTEQRISPTDIKNAIVIQNELPWMGTRLETACWRRFEELFTQMKAQGGMEEEYRKLIVQTVESFYKVPVTTPHKLTTGGL